MDEAARVTFISSQCDVAYCQATVRDCLERMSGQGDARNGPSGFQRGLRTQGGPLPGSVDLDSGFLNSVLVCM